MSGLSGLACLQVFAHLFCPQLEVLDQQGVALLSSLDLGNSSLTGGWMGVVGPGASGIHFSSSE